MIRIVSFWCCLYYAGTQSSVDNDDVHKYINKSTMTNIVLFTIYILFVSPMLRMPLSFASFMLLKLQGNSL